MWYIEVKERRIYLSPKEQVVFGRKYGRVVLSSDKSLSKQHACFCVTQAEVLQEGRPISSCTVIDLHSKYGSYVVREGKKTQISAEGCQLTSGDQVQLGLQDTLLTVTYVPILSLTSSLSIQDRTYLSNLLSDYIDGILLSKWADCCTHLTVKEPTLTQKVACALAAGVPIVTMDYWTRMRSAMEKCEPLPNPKDFQPSIKDPFIRERHLLLGTKKERQTLFTDKVFVFLHVEQYETHKDIIEAAGGNAYLYSRERFTLEDLCAPRVLVLQDPFTNVSQSTQLDPDYDDIRKALEACHRRMILQEEITLAVLYCSTNRFCNPRFKPTELLKKSGPEFVKSNILAAETQGPSQNVSTALKIISNVPVRVAIDRSSIIPETCDDLSAQCNDTTETETNEPSTSRGIILAPDTEEFSLKEENIRNVGKRKNIFDTEAALIPETIDLLVEETPESNEPRSFKKKKLLSEDLACIPETFNSNRLDTQLSIVEGKDEDGELKEQPTNVNKKATTSQGMFHEESGFSVQKLSADANKKKNSDERLTEKKEGDLVIVDRNLTEDVPINRNENNIKNVDLAPSQYVSSDDMLHTNLQVSINCSERVASSERGADKNAKELTKTWKFSSDRNQQARVPLRQNCNTTNNSFVLCKSIGKIFRKGYHKKLECFFDFATRKKVTWRK